VGEEIMTEKLEFEREICSRCFGSGNYSYCQMHGTTCFKCHGVGKVLTKRAAVALERMRAEREIPAASVKPGMRVNVCGLTLQVQSVGPSGSKYQKDGAWTPYLKIQGTKYAADVFETTMVQLIPPAAEARAQLKAAIEYQNSLTLAGTVRKQAKGADL
jgi:hypothetical protein